MEPWQILKNEVREITGIGLPDAACKAIIKKINEQFTASEYSDAWLILGFIIGAALAIILRIAVGLLY